MKITTEQLIYLSKAHIKSLLEIGSRANNANISNDNYDSGRKKTL
jgi:hypothetical protein